MPTPDPQDTTVHPDTSLSSRRGVRTGERRSRMRGQLPAGGRADEWKQHAGARRRAASVS